MSDDFSSVTEVTTTGWLQRLLGGIIGALIGILLIIGSIALLWWNGEPCGKRHPRSRPGRAPGR